MRLTLNGKRPFAHGYEIYLEKASLIYDSGGPALSLLTADGKSVVVVLLPDGRKSEPKRPDVATGPIVRLAMDPVKDPERNYASLLNDPYEADLLEYYTTGQLALIDVKAHTVKKIGAPAMIQSVDAAPDGLYFHVTTMQRPFSYIVAVTECSPFSSHTSPDFSAGA